MTPAEHAERAATLLAGLDTLEQRLEDMSDEDRLQMVVSGGYTRANRDMHYTVELAHAHALTAIALELAGRAALVA